MRTSRMPFCSSSSWRSRARDLARCSSWPQSLGRARRPRCSARRRGAGCSPRIRSSSPTMFISPSSRPMSTRTVWVSERKLGSGRRGGGDCTGRCITSGVEGEGRRGPEVRGGGRVARGGAGHLHRGHHPAGRADRGRSRRVGAEERTGAWPSGAMLTWAPAAAASAARFSFEPKTRSKAMRRLVARLRRRQGADDLAQRLERGVELRPGPGRSRPGEDGAHLPQRHALLHVLAQPVLLVLGEHAAHAAGRCRPRRADRAPPAPPPAGAPASRSPIASARSEASAGSAPLASITSACKTSSVSTSASQQLVARRHLPQAQGVEHVLGAVGERGDPLQAEHRREALERVGGAEDAVEEIRVRLLAAGLVERVAGPGRGPRGSRWPRR